MDPLDNFYTDQSFVNWRKSVDMMRNNLDGDVTKSYKMNAQFVFVNDMYRIKPVLPLCYEEKPQNMLWKKNRK